MSFRRAAPVVALSLMGLLLFGATCTTGPESGVEVDPHATPGEVPASARSLELIGTLRRAFPSIDDSAASGFLSDAAGPSAGLVAKPRRDLGPPPAGVRARVEVAHAARGGALTRVVERTSGLAFGFGLRGSSAELAEPADGFLVLHDALPALPGSALVTRALTHGVEEYVYLPSAPAEARLRWDLELDNVSALRLRSGVLELVGADGRPVMRMHRPWVEGADGVRHDAEVSVDGCVVDRDAAPPWRRELPEPGASRCTVTVDWSRADVRYPALVDPVWQATGLGLAFGRLGHTATSIDATGEVLIVGGYDPVSGAALTSTEFYSFCTDPCQPSFSIGPDLIESRGGHTEAYLAQTQRVLVVGGRSVRGGGVIRSSSELIDCSTGTCVVTTVAGAGARFQHTATRFESTDGVLIAGGSGTNPSTAVVFDPATSAFGAPFNLTTKREAHAAELILDGSNRILLAGGIGPSFVLSSAEIFTPGSPGSFAAAGGNMTSPRAFASAARLEDANKRILIAGGTNQATLTIPGIFSKTADIYDPVTNTFLQQAKQMASARAGHTATKLSGEGKVLLAGGINNPVSEPDNLTGSTDTTDFYDTVTGNFLFNDVPLQAKRSEHAAVRLTLGPVLVTGGAGKQVNGTTGAQAELLLRSPGDKCDTDGECSTGFCANTANGKICCNEPCSGICRSCATDPLFTPGTCHDEADNTPQSSLCAVVGLQEASITLVCNGLGGVKSSSAQDCQAFKCDPVLAKCRSTCSSDSECVGTGFCDTFAHLCKFKPAKGEACGPSTQCLNGLPCVDGVCCNADCTGQCEACDLLGKEGECSQVEQEQPHGGRPECTGNGAACGGVCGSQKEACDYPTVTCGALSCSAGSSSAAKCELGVCNNTNTECAPYLCQNSSSCAQSCDTSADCVANHVCVEDECKEVISALCDPVANLIVSPGGQTLSCGNYRCSVSTNACLDACTSLDQCGEGFVCDTSGKCIDAPTVVAASDACSVSAAGRPGSPGALHVTAVAAAWLLWRRRRRLPSAAARGAAGVAR